MAETKEKKEETKSEKALRAAKELSALIQRGVAQGISWPIDLLNLPIEAGYALAGKKAPLPYGGSERTIGGLRAAGLMPDVGPEKDRVIPGYISRPLEMAVPSVVGAPIVGAAGPLARGIGIAASKGASGLNAMRDRNAWLAAGKGAKESVFSPTGATWNALFPAGVGLAGEGARQTMGEGSGMATELGLGLLAPVGYSLARGAKTKAAQEIQRFTTPEQAEQLANIRRQSGMTVPLTEGPYVTGGSDARKNLASTALADATTNNPSGKDRFNRMVQGNEDVIRAQGRAQQGAPIGEVTQAARQDIGQTIGQFDVPPNVATNALATRMLDWFKVGKDKVAAAFNDLRDPGGFAGQEVSSAKLKETINELGKMVETQQLSNSMVPSILGRFKREGTVTPTAVDPATGVITFGAKGTDTPLGNQTAMSRGDGSFSIADYAPTSDKISGASLLALDQDINAAWKNAQGVEKVMLAKLKDGVRQTIKDGDETLAAQFKDTKDLARDYYTTFWGTKEVPSPTRRFFDSEDPNVLEDAARTLLTGQKSPAFGRQLTEIATKYGDPSEAKALMLDTVKDQIAQATVGKAFAGTAESKLKALETSDKEVGRALKSARAMGISEDELTGLVSAQTSAGANPTNKALAKMAASDVDVTEQFSNALANPTLAAELATRLQGSLTSPQQKEQAANAVAQALAQKYLAGSSPDIAGMRQAIIDSPLVKVLGNQEQQAMLTSLERQQGVVDRLNLGSTQGVNTRQISQAGGQMVGAAATGASAPLGTAAASRGAFGLLPEALTMRESTRREMADFITDPAKYKEFIDQQGGYARSANELAAPGRIGAIQAQGLNEPDQTAPPVKFVPADKLEFDPFAGATEEVQSSDATPVFDPFAEKE